LNNPVVFNLPFSSGKSKQSILYLQAVPEKNPVIGAHLILLRLNLGQSKGRIIIRLPERVVGVSYEFFSLFFKFPL